MLITSICCWVGIIIFIILVIHGIYRDFKHRKMYKEIQKTTMFKSKWGLLGPYLSGDMGGFKIRYKSEQKFSGGKDEELWIIKITIIHPKRLFPSHIDKSDHDVIRALNIIRPKSIVIKKNRNMEIEIAGKPENNEEILHLVRTSILLAKTIDCGK